MNRLDIFIADNREAVSKSLGSVLYGDFVDRDTYNAGIELIDDPEKRDVWKRRWEDSRRTSMSRICQRAWELCRIMTER